MKAICSVFVSLASSEIEHDTLLRCSGRSHLSRRLLFTPYLAVEEHPAESRGFNWCGKLGSRTLQALDTHT